MKITKDDVNIRDFDGWSGAEDTVQRIIDEDLCDEFDTLMEELYPDGIDETSLNDILRFEEDWVFEMLGISDEEEETEDEECDEDDEE